MVVSFEIFFLIVQLSFFIYKHIYLIRLLIMLPKIILNNKFGVRISKDLFKDKNNSTPTSYVSFPYRFGGVAQYNPNDTGIETFAHQSKTNLLNTYLKLLDSVQKKDQTALKTLVQPRLLKPLLSNLNIEQINKQKEIQIYFSKFSLGIGVLFENSQEFSVLKNQRNISIYSLKDTAKLMSIMRNGMPILISYHLVLRSKRKLIIRGAQKNDLEEAHVLVIQQQVSKQPQSMMKYYSQGFTPSGMEEFRKSLLSTTAPWRIGNIDSFLASKF